MRTDKTKQKFTEWLRRYMVAELLGTLIALGFAYAAFHQSHSYVLAAAAGFVGEGIGFYGYFITSELVTNSRTYRGLRWTRRLGAIIAKSSTNLLIEFAPAEVVDNFFIRPFLMYYMPQHVRPYALGFVVGKFAADLLFYAFAICGYELKRRLNRRPAG